MICSRQLVFMYFSYFFTLICLRSAGNYLSFIFHIDANRQLLFMYFYMFSLQLVLIHFDVFRSRGNGPSFIFRMDANAADVIRASFKVEHDSSKYYYLLSLALFRKV